MKKLLCFAALTISINAATAHVDYGVRTVQDFKTSAELNNDSPIGLIDEAYGVAVDPSNGDVYVLVDSGPDDFILRYAEDGSFISASPSLDSLDADGGFNVNPTGVAISGSSLFIGDWQSEDFEAVKEIQIPSYNLTELSDVTELLGIQDVAFFNGTDIIAASSDSFGGTNSAYSISTTTGLITGQYTYPATLTTAAVAIMNSGAGELVVVDENSGEGYLIADPFGSPFDLPLSSFLGFSLLQPVSVIPGKEDIDFIISDIGLQSLTVYDSSQGMTFIVPFTEFGGAPFGPEGLTGYSNAVDQYTVYFAQATGVRRIIFGLAPPDTPNISFTNNFISFGSVDPANPPVSETLEFFNTGTADLVTSLTIVNDDSGAFSVTQDPSGVITPGNSSILEVTFAPDTERFYGGQLQLETNVSGSESINIFLDGLGDPIQPAISPLFSDPINFGSIPVGIPQSETYFVANSGELDLTVSAFLSDDASGVLTLTEPLSPVSPSGSTSFEIIAEPLSAGPFTGELTITSNDPDTPTIVTSVIGDAFEPEPEIELLNTSIDFGKLEIGAPPRTETVYYTNRGIADLFTTPSLTNDGGGAYAIKSEGENPLPPGKGTFLELEVSSATSGTIAGELNLATNDSDESSIPVTLTALFSSDVTPPSTTITGPAGTLEQAGSIFDITWTGSDDPGGTGLASVELLYRYNRCDGAFDSYGTFTTSPISFDASIAGGSGFYQFVLVGTDNDGNVELFVGPDVELAFFDTDQPFFAGFRERGLGNAGFNFLTAIRPLTGNLNGDGNEDFVVGTIEGDLIVNLGDGNLNFTESARFNESGITIPFFIDDFNGDGNQDIFYGSITSQLEYQILLGDGAGDFTEGQSFQYNAFAFNAKLVELTGDSEKDLLLGGENGNIEIFASQGDGTFTPLSTITGDDGLFIFEIAEVNGDTNPDIVATDDADLIVYPGLGGGSFDTGVVTPLSNPQSSFVIEDLNDDNLDDVVLFSFSQEIAIYLSDGANGFTSSAIANTFAPLQLLTFDFNSDNAPDIISSFNSGSHIQVYLNDGSGGFNIPSASINVNQSGRFYGVEDFDNDNDFDILTTEVDFPDELLAVYLGNDDGTFSQSGLKKDQVPGNLLFEIFADFDNDGDKDALGLNIFSSTTPLAVFENRLGDGAEAITSCDTEAPFVTSGPTVFNLTDSTAFFSWDTNEPATTELTVLDFNTGAPVATETVPGFRTSHSVAIDSLTPDTTYQYAISLTDEAGNGPEISLIGTFSTLDVTDTNDPYITAGPIVQSVSDDSATIFWTTNEPADSSIDFGLADGALSSNATDSRLVREHSVTLTGLTPGTEYDYQVSSTDSAGNGPASSSIRSFFTNASPDTDAPVIVSGPIVNSISNKSATIEWDTDEAANSSVTFNNGVTFSTITDTNLTKNHSIRLGGLDPTTEYSFSVSSTDGLGNGPVISNVFEFTTTNQSDFIAPQILEGPAVINISSDFAVIRWVTDEPSYSYIIYGENFPRFLVDDFRYTTEHVVQVRNLNPQTIYTYIVESFDREGNSSSTPDLFFTTDAGPDTNAPIIYAGPILTGLTDTTASFYWLTDEPATSNVRYGASIPLTEEVTETDLTTEHRVTITGLTPGQSYFLEISSTDAAGNESSPISLGAGTKGKGTGDFTTDTDSDETAPQIISGPTVVDVTEDSAIIQWTTDEIADSRVNFNIQGQPLTNVVSDGEDVTVHTVVLTNLQFGAPYEAIVSSIDVTGNGPTESSPLFFTTDSFPDFSEPVFVDGPNAEEIGTGLVEVTWETDEFATTTVQYGETSGVLNEFATLPGTRSNHNATLTNLQEGVVYYFQVTTTDISGNSAVSSEESFQLGSVSVDHWMLLD